MEPRLAEMDLVGTSTSKEGALVVVHISIHLTTYVGAEVGGDGPGGDIDVEKGCS